MKREIKFRGIYVENKKMIYGNIQVAYKHTAGLGSVPYYRIDNVEDGNFEIKDGTLSQYTGLQDKNGTNIFEGDIVKFQEQVLEVKYKANVASFVLRNKEVCWHFNTFDTGEIKIIGNIYQNPELLDTQPR